MSTFIEYRPVVGFPGYEVGSDGGVRVQVTAHFWRHLKHVIKKKTGYSVVGLIYPNGRQAQRTVHYLVLTAFRGPRPTGQEARHLNGIRFDCRLDNLAWGTKQENEADKIEHGSKMYGERNHQHRLTVIDVKRIRELLVDHVPTNHIALTFGVSGTMIRNIRDGKAWSWLT